MASVTSRIGLGATLSPPFQHPFYAARIWATLDHLTGGRAAWNVATSLNQNEAANYGQARSRSLWTTLWESPRVHRGMPTIME